MRRKVPSTHGRDRRPGRSMAQRVASMINVARCVPLVGGGCFARLPSNTTRLCAGFAQIGRHPRRLRPMSIGRHDWPSDWIRRKPIWDDMDSDTQMLWRVLGWTGWFVLLLQRASSLMSLKHHYWTSCDIVQLCCEKNLRYAVESTSAFRNAAHPVSAHATPCTKASPGHGRAVATETLSPCPEA